MKANETSFPRVFVVVLNYNGWQDTVSCVESLLRLDPPATQIVVVDNASSDESVNHLRSWAQGEFVPQLTSPDKGISPVPAAKPLLMEEFSPNASKADERGEKRSPVVLIRNCENRGYAAGNNVGIRHAVAHDADAVWILNNDTVVKPDALAAMVSRLFSKSQPGLCGSLIRYFCNPDAVQCRGGGWTSRITLLSRLDGNDRPVTEALSESPEAVEQRLNFIYGASVMASREFLDGVGLMDEGYFLYCEEQDWSFSAGGRFDLAYAPGAHVFHKEGISTGWSAERFRPRMLYWLVRSRLRLAIRHCRWALPTVVLGLAYAVLRLLWRQATRARKSKQRNETSL